MCGIAGFTAPGPEARSVLGGMTRALAHRGPDGSGVWTKVTPEAYLRASAQPKIETESTRKPRPSLPKNWIGRSNARSMK